jgi:hypothetical protein
LKPESPETYSRKAVALTSLLSRDLFVREVRNIGALASVLNSNPANVALLVDVQKSILIQIPSLGDIDCPKFDIKRVGILEILNLHGLNDRSKKACGPFLGLQAV